MARISTVEKVHAWVETAILNRLVPQKEVGPVFKWVFKIPVLQYKLGLGWLTGRTILLLTTVGRKTGKLRYTPLEYEYDASSGRYRIAAGWAGNTDWYRNLRVNPHVIVQVGRIKFSALAAPAPEQEVAEYMLRASQQHPRMDKVWNRWSDRPVDGTFGSYLYAARFFPAVWLTPVENPSPERPLERQP